MVLANNATIDLTACLDTVNTPGLFTSGANEIIFPAAEEVTPEDPEEEPYVVPSNVFIELHGRAVDFSKIIGWNGIPANVNFVPTEATIQMDKDFRNGGCKSNVDKWPRKDDNKSEPEIASVAAGHSCGRRWMELRVRRSRWSQGQGMPEGRRSKWQAGSGG